MTVKYSKDHEWVKVEGGIATIGITDHAQELLGDLVHLELPEVDSEYGLEDAIAVAESVKAASDIYAPVSGTVVEVNEGVLDAPELVNSDAYGEGWLFTIRLDDEDELQELMDASAYRAMLEEESGEDGAEDDDDFDAEDEDEDGYDDDDHDEDDDGDNGNRKGRK